MTPTDNRPLCVPQSHPRHRKGFNLVEAAIVLGVVGLVIGGIWVAASAVSENMKVKRLSEGLQLIYSGVRNQFKNMPVGMSGIVLADPSNGAIDAISRLGVVPEDFLNNGKLITPWGHGIYVRLSGTGSTLGDTGIDFTIRGKSQATCIKAATVIIVNNWANLNPGAFTKIYSGWTSSTVQLDWSPYGAAPSFSVIANACPAGDWQIVMTYKR